MLRESALEKTPQHRLPRTLRVVLELDGLLKGGPELAV